MAVAIRTKILNNNLLKWEKIFEKSLEDKFLKNILRITGNNFEEIVTKCFIFEKFGEYFAEILKRFLTNFENI